MKVNVFDVRIIVVVVVELKLNWFIIFRITYTTKLSLTYHIIIIIIFI